jgi:PAS domain S-box-containing protein
MTTPVFPRTRFAFLWIALIPVALTAVAFWVGGQFQNEIAWISHSYNVRTTIRETILLMSNAERDLRNYLLTHQDRYLRLMETDTAQVQLRLEELRRLTVDDVVQSRNVARLKPLVGTKIEDLHQTANRINGGMRASLTPAEVDRSQGLMEEIRGVTRDMMLEEERLLLSETQVQSRIGRQAEIIYASAILVTLLLLLWAARLAKDYAAKRDRAELALQQKVAEIEILNRQLEGRVAERTAELRVSNEELARAYEASRQLASIVESSEDAIVGTSLEGTVQTWNAGAARLYGYQSHEILGHNISELIPPDRLHEESRTLESLRKGERVEHFESIRLRKDGGSVDVSLTISPICANNGQISGVSDVARDITDKKRSADLMRQTQKLESLGVLAGGIAHDFNNLLVGILGNASVALEELPGDSVARMSIQDLVSAGERAAALTRQMLAYSGRGHFVLERIDLSTYVRETIPLIRAAISRTVEVRMDLAEGLPPIEADTAQVQQLVMNLVINGAEAMSDGKPGTVFITTRQQNVDEQHVRAQAGTGAGDIKPGLYVMLEVRDTGSGMDSATQARIFEPFFTTKFTGRGLGLAAVLGIVRGHAGFIQVISNAGQGSVFRVLFPAVAVSLERTVRPARKEAQDLSGVGVILIIDDEETVRIVAKRSLEHYGYEVLVAENGERGVEVFRRNVDRVQCVVLDMAMPVMGGEETLPRLKSVRADIPVILSSGFSESEAVPRFQGKGLTGFIQKPYKAATLSAKIKAVLGAEAARDEGDRLARRPA